MSGAEMAQEIARLKADNRQAASERTAALAANDAEKAYAAGLRIDSNTNKIRDLEIRRDRYASF